MADRASDDEDRGTRQRWWTAALVGALALAGAWLVLAADVAIGAGDSAGLTRRMGAIVRATDRALAATGWADGWRLAAWACGVAAVLLGLLLVWVAAGVRDVAFGGVQGLPGVAFDGRHDGAVGTPSGKEVGAGGYGAVEDEAQPA